MKKLLLKTMLLLCALVVGGSAWGQTTSTLTFTAACGGTGTADDGASWTVTSDGTESGNNDYMAGEAAYALTVQNPVDNSVVYTLVEDASTLADGDVVIFVESTSKNAMGAAKSDNYGVKAITFEDDGTIVPVAGVTEMTLVADNGYWRFKVGQNSYLYAAGGLLNNYLKANTLATVKNNGKAIISISSGDATITFQGNTSSSDYRGSLRYNKSSTLFNCYKASYGITDYITNYSLVKLYRKQTTKTLNNVGGSAYATMYYSDQAFVVPTDVKAKTYKLEGGVLVESTVYNAGDVIPANEAVVLSGESGDHVFKVGTTNATPDGNNVLKGSDGPALTTGGDLYYALSLNSAGENIGFYWMEDDGAAFMNGAHKAYLALPSSGGSVKSFYTFDSDEATGVKVSTKDEGPRTIYDLQGRRLSESSVLLKGVYIVNGKKVIIK